MSKFLLDANLSPKIARHLSIAFALDVTSLLRLGLGELPDHEVLRLARANQRVIITLDRDFLEPYTSTGQVQQGIIYLDLPSSRRYIPAIIAVLDAFFRNQSPDIDLDRALIILREDLVEIHRSAC